MEVGGHFWSVEIALPIDKVLERSIHPHKKPGHGDYWRINFSRVEWRVLVEDDIYVKDPAFPHEDNWVWSPQGEIAMHLPERWGFLQFSEVEMINVVASSKILNFPLSGSARLHRAPGAE